MPELHVESEHSPVVVESDPDPVPLPALVRAGDEVLGPVLGELHRPQQLPGRPRHQHLFRPRVHNLDAEPAAHVGRDHIDVGEREIQLGRDRGPDSGRGLGRAPDPQPLGLGVPPGQHTPAFERSRRRALDGQVQFKHVRRVGDRRDRVAVALREFGGYVARHVGVHQVLACASAVNADDGGQRLVLHDDRLGRVFGQVPVGRDHHGDRLAHVVDLIGGQREPGPRMGQRRMRDQQRQRLGYPPGQVLVGVDRDQPGHVERGGDVNVDNSGVRVRAANKRGRQRVVPEVIEVSPVPAEQPVVFEPRDRLAEHGGHDERCRFNSAARSTALTMF